MSLEGGNYSRHNTDCEVQRPSIKVENNANVQVVKKKKFLLKRLLPDVCYSLSRYYEFRPPEGVIELCSPYKLTHSFFLIFNINIFSFSSILSS